MAEKIFDNIYDAWNYIRQQEIQAYNADPRFHNPPMVVKVNPMSPLPTVMTVDNIDYPLNGYFNNAAPDQFVMSRLGSGRYSLKPNLCRRKFLFRGQTQFYDPCLTNLNRQDHYYVEECMLRDEMVLLMLSHPLVQLLDQGIVIDGRKVSFEMNLYGLTQHYYNKTSLLDLTTSPEVASFFATSRYNSDDTYSPITDDGGIGVLYYYELDIAKDFKPAQLTSDHRVTTIGLQVFPRSGRQYGILCEMDKMGNFNQLDQVKYVKFKQNATISKTIFDNMESGKRLFPEDILSKHWTANYVGKKKLSLQSLRLNQKNNSDKTFEELKQMMEEKEYSFEEYQPQFTPEEIAEYFQEIQNGYWEHFCQKIFIPGDKDGSFIRQLYQVRFNPDYRWAFEPNIPHQLNLNEGFVIRHYAPFLQLP